MYGIVFKLFDEESGKHIMLRGGGLTRILANSLQEGVNAVLNHESDRLKEMGYTYSNQTLIRWASDKQRTGHKLDGQFDQRKCQIVWYGDESVMLAEWMIACRKHDSFNPDRSFNSRGDEPTTLNNVTREYLCRRAAFGDQAQ